MVNQGNTDDDTGASFSLVKACQHQVQLPEDKNPHIKTPHCPVLFPTFLFTANPQSVMREISSCKADVSDQKWIPQGS